MAHVMVLDDEPGICWAFRSFLEERGHRVSIASTAEQGLARAKDDPPDVLLLDVRLPGIDGLTALSRFQEIAPDAKIIVMTAHGTVKTAVEALKGGAFDYLPKPFDLDQVRSLIDRALQARNKHTKTRAESPEPYAIVGSSLPIQMVFKQIAIASGCFEPVLISGESGTGKELVARAIHANSDRAREPFVVVHLAALPESLIERELFGHEKGAYTGAEASRTGLLELAGRGTIFFDEIGDAPFSAQTKLLRVLDGGEYRAVGGGAEKTLRARVVAATNRDLIARVRSGEFRADLYHRLAVLTIQLPPLRDRKDDILVLWDHFLERAAEGDRPRLDPSSALAKILFDYPWPGNVRELKNAAEHAARAAREGPIAVEHLPVNVREKKLMIDGIQNPSDSTHLESAIRAWVGAHWEDREGRLHDRLVEAVEAPLFHEALARSKGLQARVAERLGLHRSTLRQKLRKLGIDPAQSESADNPSPSLDKKPPPPPT